MKGVWLIRSQPKESDGRLIKYVNLLKETNRNYKVVSWYRKGHPNAGSDDVLPYLKLAKTGARFKNALNLIGWNWFILRAIFKNRHQIGLIHAADFDTILPCILGGKCLGIPIVYDIYDKYTASREIKGIVGWLFDKLEMFAINTSNHTILPDVSRYEQFGIPTTNSEVTIIENVPMYSTIPTSKASLEKTEGTDYVLCYVGILEATHRGIEDLLKVVSTKPTIQLHIAGFGPLEEEVTRYAEKYHNINFLGELDRAEAFHVMEQSDIHVGMYYKTVSNHYYAAPNKYYEHLYFGKPLITTQGTPPGNRVQELSTGWSILEGESNIASCLDNLDSLIVSDYASNARKQWDNKYSDYKEYFHSTYLSIVDGFLSRKNEKQS